MFLIGQDFEKLRFNLLPAKNYSVSFENYGAIRLILYDNRPDPTLKTLEYAAKILFDKEN